MTDLPASFLAWPPEAHSFFEERAGIRQHLGKHPKARAEELAEEDTRREWRRGVFLGGTVPR